jgi:acylphosphatase
MEEKTLHRLHAVIEGRVQGVGFRYFVQDKALSMGLTGWVRNRWNRTVETVMEGEKADLEKMLVHLRRGPRAAIVSNVTPTWKTASGEFTGFNIRF